MNRLFPLWVLLIAIHSSGSAAPPLIMWNGREDTTGLEKVQYLKGISNKNIKSSIISGSLSDGSRCDMIIIEPSRGETKADISAIVFVAPYPHERFRTAQSLLAKALVCRLGCMVISIDVDDSPKSQWWGVPSFYVYPTAGYLRHVEDAILSLRKERGLASIPIFGLGYSAGGVMALYAAQSTRLEFAGVVAMELSQDEKNMPNVLENRVPTLLISPDTNLANRRIASLSRAENAGSLVDFVVTRSIVDMVEAADGGMYYRKAGGLYADDLAYCFIRDAVALDLVGKWPAAWQRKDVNIESAWGGWMMRPFVSSEDYMKLYELASHNYIEEVGAESCVIVAQPPFRRAGTIVLLRERQWSYLDGVRMASLLNQIGLTAIIGNAAGTDDVLKCLRIYLAGREEGSSKLILVNDGNIDWLQLVLSHKGNIETVILSPAEADKMTQGTRGTNFEEIAIISRKPKHEEVETAGASNYDSWIDFSGLMNVLKKMRFQSGTERDGNEPTEG